MPATAVVTHVTCLAIPVLDKENTDVHDSSNSIIIILARPVRVHP